MRFAAPNNALTTIPALTGGSSGVSSIAHIATGNGCETPFVLVNFNRLEDVLPSPFQLNLFDDNGDAARLARRISATASGTTAVTVLAGERLGPKRDADHRNATPLYLTPRPPSAPLSSLPRARWPASSCSTQPNGRKRVVSFESRKAGGLAAGFRQILREPAAGVAVDSVSSQPHRHAP